MQTGSVEEISKMADNHWRDLVKELEANPRYVPISEKLVALEVQQGNFDFLGVAVQIVPSTIVAAINAGCVGYKKHWEAKDLEWHRNELATIMGNALDKQNKSMPTFDTMSPKQAMAYQLFLDKFSTNDLAKDGPLCRALTDLKGKTNARLQGAEFTEFENIRKQQQELHAVFNTMNQGIRNGQEQFQKELGNIKVFTNNNYVEVINKLQELGVTITDELRDVLNNSQEVRQQVTNMHRYFMAQARQAREDAEQQKQANFQGLAATCGFLGELGKHVKSKELQQVATIGAACVKIAQAATAIQGLTSLSLAALNPIMAIGMGALAIMSAFAKQGPDPTKLILDAIRSVQLQIDNLRKEMHTRFNYVDEMLGKILKKLIVGFCELHFENNQIKTLLKQFIVEMRESHSVIQATINTMSSGIDSIANNLERRGRREKIETINKLVTRVLSGFKVQDKQLFVDLFQGLTEEVKDTQLTNPLLVGESMDQNPGIQLKRLEGDAHNPFFAEFNIALVHGKVNRVLNIGDKALANPALWRWQALGLMHLVQRRYPQVGSGEVSISELEVSNLKMILALGEDLQKFILKLQDKNLLDTFREELLTAGKDLENELEAFIHKTQDEITAKLNLDWQNKMDALNAGVVNDFQHQVFEVTDNVAGKGWFDAYLKSGHLFAQRGNRSITNLANPREYKFVQEDIAAYRQERQQSIASFKTKVIQEMHLPLTQAITLANQGGRPLRFNEYKLYSEPRVDEFFSHLSFIYPETNGQPILPMAPGYRPYIPARFYQAEWLGIGRLNARYRIQQNQFILSMHFVMADQSVQIGSDLVQPYLPGIYQGNEAIWNFWSGGNFSAAGETEDKALGDQPGGRQHVLRPKCDTRVPGLRDTLNYRPDPYEVKAVNLVAPKIVEKQQQLNKEVHEKLINLLKNNEEHSLTKAMIKYANCYYMLRGVINLAFHDVTLDYFAPDLIVRGMLSRKFAYLDDVYSFSPKSEIKSETKSEVKGEEQTSDRSAVPVLRHRNDFVAVLENFQGNMSLRECFSHNLLYIRERLSDEIQNLCMSKEPQDLCDDSLKITLEQFRGMLNKYEATKVSQNDLTERQNDPLGLIAKANELKAKLLNIKTAEEQQRVFQEWVSMQQSQVILTEVQKETKAESKRSGASPSAQNAQSASTAQASTDASLGNQNTGRRTSEFQPRSDSPLATKKPESKRDDSGPRKKDNNEPYRADRYGMGL